MKEKCYIIPVQKECNCSCLFCISKSRDYNKNEHFLKCDDRFIKNIYQLKQNGIKRFEITGGGEPFLNSSLQQLIYVVKMIIPDSYIKLYTNGNILKKIDGIDELDISVVSNDIGINNKFMHGNNITLDEKLKFFNDNNIKIRLSIPLIKGGIDDVVKLREMIDSTSIYVSEYVVRTLYPHTLNLEKLYVDFKFDDNRVIFERNNDVSDFYGHILWSDNNIYSDWNLNTKRIFNSYLLLKPDSRTYINEICKIIEENGFNIYKIYILNNFKENALNLYNDKDSSYLKLIKLHLDNISYLFGNQGLIFYLMKDNNIFNIINDTLKIKEYIRQKYSFTHALNGYLTIDDNISHLNLVHCPDCEEKKFEDDINYFNSLNLHELDNDQFTKIKKYRSYNI